MHTAEQKLLLPSGPTEAMGLTFEAVPEDMANFDDILSQLQTADELGILDMISITDAQASDHVAEAWESEHQTAVKSQVLKLEKLSQFFDTIFNGMAATLSVLPNFIQAAAALCPHCIVPIAQMAGHVGSMAGSASGFNLGGIPGGHFHADGSWHADEHDLSKQPRAKPMTPPRVQHASRAHLENVNPWGRGMGVVSFGLIELFMHSLIPDPQSA